MKGDVEVGENGAVGTVPVSRTREDRTARRLKSTVVLLRVLTVMATTVAFALMFTDKQTFHFNQYISVTAKYTGITALAFHAYVNAVAAIYSSIQGGILLLIPRKGVSTDSLRAWATFFMDQIIAYLLLAAVAAATEVAYIAERGDTDVAWEEKCSRFDKFCKQVGASVLFGFIGLLAHCVTTVISAYFLFHSRGRVHVPENSKAAALH